ncbi:hypothetical protein PVAND_012214 [Polypedilum vanderplanki]|uniref:HECT-type E3 ubiquitin transferase n=1 Tax=Polypedilum vanderplanki TaxID=319348 RepID=A0A9J6CLR6_POLVA|nr:hypothetical protein PVAND_012214 [Polypedilum vanderplanki]
MENLLPLLTALDHINRLLYDTDVKNSDHMGWPGIISTSRDNDSDRMTANEAQLIRKNDFENSLLDGCKFIIINGCVYDVKDFICENSETQSLIESNIGKDLTNELSALEHQKTLEDITGNNSIFIGKYETETASKCKKFDQSYEKLCYFESEKTLAWILGMRSNILQKATCLQPAEITCKKMLNSIILRGGLQTNIANPFDEEKFEARSSGSTAGSTPTTDVFNILGDLQPITQFSPLQLRIQSLIYGLAEGKTNDPNVSAWISLFERYCKENNLIWHQEYSTDHPIIDVERLLTAVLIRHQSLGTLVLAVIDRDLTGSVGKIPQPITDIIKIVHMMKWNLIKIRQQLNRSYKEVCTPILEKCRFLLYEVRPAISPEQSGLKKLFHHYKEPRFKTIVKQIIEENQMNREDQEIESAKIDDLLNASIQSNHNSLSKVAQFVSEHFERHLSNESLHKIGSSEAMNFEMIPSKTPSNENLLAVDTPVEECSPLMSNAEESVLAESEVKPLNTDEFVNNVILKLSERYNQNEDAKFKTSVNNQIIDFVMQENLDVETLRRAMFCQIQRYQTRKEGLKMFNELLSINNLLDAAKYNIYNGFLNSAYGEENAENYDHQYDHILENLNLITAYQKADILIAHSHILEWTIKEFQKYVNQEPIVNKQKWTHGDKDQTNLGTYVFLKKVSRARFLLMIFGLLSKNYTANELSLLINSGLLGTSLGLLHQTGSNDLPQSNKNDKELSVVYEENIKLKHNFSKDGMLTGPELVKQMKIGTRVARGADWKWGEQDGNGEGRIISEVGDDGWVRVEWDTGATNSYRMGKEGQYDLRLADSSFKTISPDKESDKDNELYESKLQQNDFHPTKLLKNACIKLLQMISTSVGVHGDKMQNDAVRVFVTMFYAILSQKGNYSLNIGLDMWRSIAFLRSILRSQSISKHITSDLWIKLYFDMLKSPIQNEKDVYKKVQCIKLLQSTLTQWNDSDIDRTENIVNQLFLHLGNICMNCPHDQSLTQLPIGIKTKVLASASHSGTIAEELITLLRKLHTLPLWNETINNFISQKMCVAADMFIDMERENGIYEEKLNVSAALNVIGGFDPRLRIGIDLIYDSVKCSIYRVTQSGTIILNVHNSNETKNISFAKVEKVIEQGIFSLSKLSLNEMLLNSWAVLMYGMNMGKSIESVSSFDISFLSNQQIQLAAVKATQVLFRHQSLLKTILKQRSPGILKYSSDDSMSDDSKNQKSDESDHKKDTPSVPMPKHELLVQSMLSRAIQSSPLKACYTQTEMEIAALAICQTLSAHFKNNHIPASHVKFQNVKQATMIHGVPLYNESVSESIYNTASNYATFGSESSRANPATKLVIQIMEMGFTRKTVELALKQITNRVEILPTAEQVVQWIIDHPESIVDEDSKCVLNKINSFNVASAIDSDNDSTCSENLNSSSLSQHDKPAKYAKRDDFKNSDQYAIYVRSHIVPGMIVRCCRDFEEIRAGDIGIVLKIEPDELHDLNVRVDFKNHERPFWMCFGHLQLLEPPSEDIKSLNITYGSHVKIKPTSGVPRTQAVKNIVGVVTAINGLEVIVDFPQQKSWCGQLYDLELVHPASTEHELYDIIDDWSQCVKSLTVSSNEGLAKNLLERTTSFWQSANSQGRPWIRLEMRENILIHSLSLRIEPNDCSHQPSTIIVRTGDSLSNLKDFNWVTIRSNDTHVIILSNVRQYFNWIEIYIKQCRNNGIQCRIHDLYIVGKRKQTDIDAMLTNAAFLANDNDINEPTYASSSSGFLDDKISSKTNLNRDEGASRVYVWGLNDKEQLAGLKGSKVKIPMYSAILSNLKPIHIAGGSKSLFIVSQDGKLYACGEGTNGRLGLGHNNNVSTPQQVPVLSQYIVKKIAVHSGGKHCLAITLDGKIFSFGEGEDGKLGHGNRLTLEKPKLIETLKTKRIRDVACGSAHSAAITSQGELYTWGCGEYGRLGHGDNQTLLKPKLVQKLVGQRVVQVACGSRDAQTLCLTEDGTVYSWGDGDFGKLGRGGSDGCSVPQPIERLNGLGIIQIECGAQFSLALTKIGEIWTFGKGDYYRLGHGSDQHVRKPTPIQGLRGKKVVHVAVGALHCLAVTDQGQIYAWGDNDHGQQGSGTTSVNKKPTLVVGLDGVFVNRVACGSSHSVAWSLPDNELEHEKKEAVPFAFPKDPLGGHSLGMYSIDDQTTASPSIVCKAKQPRKSLSEIILSLESPAALQIALSHILSAIKILQARSCIIAALTSHAQIKNHQTTFDADKILKEVKPEDIIEQDKQDVIAQTNQRDFVNSQIASGGGESLADDCEMPAEAEILNDIEYPNNPLPNTSNSLYRSLTNSMSMSISSVNNAAQKASRMSTSAMSVMACIINRQEEMINETNVTKSTLDEFLSLFGETESRNLLELLKLSVCGRISASQTNAETIANTLIELGLNSSTIGNMIIETCISELEDLTSRHCLEKVPKPVVQESSHPYVDDITLVGHVKIPGAEYLRIEFDPQCSTEKRNDPLIIMDSSGRVIATRSGREFAQWAQEIRIPGDEMRWKFTSDNSVNGWGFRFLVHGIMPASYLQELGSDRKILSQPSIDLVMVLLDSKLSPQNPNVLLRLISALSQCAQKGTLSINQRIWCLKKIHYYLTTSKYSSHATDNSLLEIIHPLVPMILKQYEYEEGQVRTGVHLMHSEYFQCMIALACDLNVDNILPPIEAHKWSWFKRYCAAVRVAKALIRRTQLPKSFCIDVRKKLEATVGNNSGPINVVQADLSSSMTSSSSYYQSSSMQASVQFESEICETFEKSPYEDHTLFTQNHDSQLLQWFNRRPEDWAFSLGGGASTIYGFGHNHRGQLGGLDGSRIKIPTPCEALSMLRPVQIVGGEQTLYAVTHDGKVYATGYGAGGRLGIGGTDSVAVPTLIESLQHVFIKKVAVNSGGKHCLALSSDHEVFSWGEGEDGKLGHGNRDSYDRPKLIEALSGLSVIDIACGSAHSAAITSEGHLLTWGKGRYGRLGHGDSEDQLKPKVVEGLLGYRVIDVACGSGDAQTLCITDDDNVWSFGDGDYGKLGRGGSDGCKVPMKIESLAGLGVIKVECGSQFSVALTRSGSVYSWGKGDYHRLGHGNSEHIRRPKKVAALQGKKVISIATGSLHCIACTDSGETYVWGDNDEGQLGDGTVTAIQRPRLVNALQGKHIVQVVCGSAHTLAISTCPHSTNSRTLPAPPMEYDLVRDIDPEVLQNRLVLLHHFSELICPCLAMIPNEGDLSLGALRDILVYSIKEASLRKVIQCTMVRDKPHGPTIELNRIQVKRSRSRTGNGLAGIDGMKSVFGQMVQKLPLLTQESLFLPHRVWKVKFVGESVDDCGGGFSESIAEMCDELQNGSVPLLIQTPNGRGEAGANRDCFLLDPTLTSVLHMNMFRFLGVLIGIAIRTGSPLSLCLAEPVWRQLAGETLRPSDLTEVDRDYVTGLLCIRDMDDDPKIFQSMELPFSTPSAKGHEVFLSTKYTHITSENRHEYVKLALNYRLHEFDEQIKAVRDGMSKVIPVPLLSLFSATELQEMVCGSPDIPLGLLKTVATYKGVDSTSPLVQWFWEVMEEFTNQERSLFLRFVWGRTRLPRSIADFRGRDFVLQVLDKYNPADHFLPESYTCFFLLKMPRYSCKAVLMEKLKYAIHFCKSIDTDDYARVAMGDPMSHTASEDNSDIESIA